MGEEQRLGAEVTGFRPPPRPPHEVLEGRAVRLEPLSADAHAADLFRAFQGHDRLWTYLRYGPFASAEDYRRWCAGQEAGEDPRFFVLRDRESGRCGGIASFLRIDPENGVIEIGHICIAPEMQRSLCATEAMRLMMGWAFGTGHRRCEWKCDALNTPSRRAAQRLGFSYEGVFRQHHIVRGRNRDSAWFSVIDREWPALRNAFDAWLDPANFDAGGNQRAHLSRATRPLLATCDPALAGPAAPGG